VGYTPLRYTQFLLGALVIATRSAARAGRTLTARSLADQAAALGVEFGPFPLMAAAHASANARLAESADPLEVADELWAAFQSALDRGYLGACAVLGMRSLELRPDAARAALFAAAMEPAEPGSLPAVFGRLALAHTADEVAPKLELGHELIARGYVGFGITLRAQVLERMLAAGDPRADAEARELRGLAERLGGGYAEAIAAILPRGSLTPREREIAELASTGLSNNDIAARLTLSVRTVENHLHRVFRKLAVDSRAALAAALLAQR
jgi:DNA-binding CsgD family transcriptional regulator